MAIEARQEFRRGTIILPVLLGLRCTQHGYPLRQMLETHGLKIDEGTLYPLLHRLEAKGLVKSERCRERGRTRRLLSLSGKGREYVDLLIAEWKQTNTRLGELLRK